MAELPNCDIVMKGGITSGVVYPPAIIELSKRFKFKNVGGTSAGAIAAALTAAAEYGRDTPGAGFDCFAEVPGRLATNLKGFFQPQPKMRPLFRVFLAAVGRVGRPPDPDPRNQSSGAPLKPPWIALKVGLALIRGFPIASLIGAAPGVVSLVFVIHSGERGILAGIATAASLLLLTIGIPLAAAVHAILRAKAALPDNYYGLCLGWAPRREGRPLELTEWLSGLINQLAGREPDQPPLTFGELWNTRDPEAEREINLAMITTNLTHGRPYRLPLEENIFYFHPEELGKLFPPHVVDWMVKHPRHTEEPEKYRPLRPMPAAPDLPVIVATRMSLSFPGLISAVPLYAIDYGRPVDAGEREPERCWFSDGGITSNFPVHFFDSVLPRWPTFAINLRQRDPVYGDIPDVWMPESNQGGLTRAWDRFDQQPQGQRLGGFANAILLTMQNWMDNLQLRIPGYRDRVVHIHLQEGEGGMNLDMPKEVVDHLSELGECAGRKLTERFTNPTHPMGWDNHRWIRFRSTLALIERTLEATARGYTFEQAGRSYGELLQRGRDEPPKSYWWASSVQRQAGLEAIDTLVRLGEAWTKTPEKFDDDSAPDPSPVLRIMPRV